MQVNVKRRYFLNPLSTKKCYTGLTNILKMYCQRNEETELGIFVVYNPTYSGIH